MDLERPNLSIMRYREEDPYNADGERRARTFV